MARYEDSYNPNNTVKPSGAPSDYLNVRANPDAFGAQVGQAVQGLGKTLGGAANQLMAHAVQEQGLANEHEATMAELELAKIGGEISNKYKSLEGLDAANAREKVVADYMTVNNKIRERMTNDAARRAYDQVAGRRISFAVQDINSYASQQKKSAYKAGQIAALNQFIKDAGASASNPEEFNYAMQSAVFAINTLFTAPEYGDFQSVPAKTGKDGRLQFDIETEQGRVAQHTYDNYLDTAMDKVYTDAVDTISTSAGVIKADEFLQASRENISIATYNKLSKSLSVPLKTFYTREIADQQYNKADIEYKASLSGGMSTSQQLADIVTKGLPGAVITSRGRTPEQNEKVNGVPNSFHLSNNAIDFTPPKGTTKDQIIALFKSKGITPTEVIDEMATKNHFHVAHKTDSSEGYSTFADYVGANWSRLVREAEDESYKRDPGNVVLAEQARRHTEQRLGDVIREQQYANTANQHRVMDFINKNDVTDITKLESADPVTRKAWHEYAAANPYAYNNMHKIITAKNFPRQTGYGGNFYQNLLKTLNGEYTDVIQMGSEIQPEEGTSSPLTLNGQNALGNIIKSRSTTEGSAFWNEAKVYFSNLQKGYVGTGLVQGATEFSTNGEFNKALREVLPRIESGLAKGLTASQMFTKTLNGKPNPDYIEPTVPRPSWTKLNQITAESFNNLGSSPTENKIENIKSEADLIKFAKEKQLSKDQFVTLGIKQGIFKADE
jgi:hypothetical protein